MDAIAAWHAFVRSPDPQALLALLDPDATFDSPVVHTTQRGRAVTAAYLTAAAQVLGTADFRYTGEWRNAGGAILEFETEVEGIRINGIDMLAFSQDGRRIVNFKVMIRPLKAINLLHRLMGEQLAASAASATPK